MTLPDARLTGKHECNESKERKQLTGFNLYYHYVILIKENEANMMSILLLSFPLPSRYRKRSLFIIIFTLITLSLCFLCSITCQERSLYALLIREGHYDVGFNSQ